MGLGVIPVGPWRYACHAREFQYAVGCAAGIASHHNELAVAGGYIEGFLLGDEVMDGEIVLLEYGELLVAELVHLEYLQGCIGFLLGNPASNGLHVVGEELQGYLHHVGSLGIDRITDLRIAVSPEYLSGSLGCLSIEGCAAQGNGGYDEGCYGLYFAFHSCKVTQNREISVILWSLTAII